MNIRLLPYAVLSFSVLSMSSFVSAGTRDSGGGLPGTIPLPDGAFSYACKLRLEDNSTSQQRWFSEGRINITKADIKNSGGSIAIPGSAWETSGTYNPRDLQEAPQISEVVTPIESHFTGFTFVKNPDNTWQVSLRANIIFEDKVAGAGSFAAADFSSSTIAARVIATDPRKDKGHKTLDLSINCIKK